MTSLEKRSRLDRALEGLPNAEDIDRRLKTGLGLTRPRARGAAGLRQDRSLRRHHRVSGRGRSSIGHHPARLFPKGALVVPRRNGPPPPCDARSSPPWSATPSSICADRHSRAGCARRRGATITRALVAAFEAAHRSLDFEASWRAVERLDGRTPAAAQTAPVQRTVLHPARSDLLAGAPFHARNPRREGAGHDVRARGRRAQKPDPGCAFRLSNAARPCVAPAAWTKLGAPKALAHSIALMRPLTLSPTPGRSRGRGELAHRERRVHLSSRRWGVRLRQAAGPRQVTSGAKPRCLRAPRHAPSDRGHAGRTGGLVAGGHGPCPGAPHAPDRPERAVAAGRGVVGRVRRAHSQGEGRDRGDRKGPEGGWTFPKLTIANATLRELAAL